MKDLDKLLKAAKPAVPELSVNFSEKLMSQLEQVEISMKPELTQATKQKHAMFWIAVSMQLIALFIFNNSIFEIQSSGSLEVFHFGLNFIPVFIKYLPFDIILLAIVLTGFSSILWQRSRMTQRRLTKIVVATYLITGVGGTAVAATGINSRIKSNLLRSAGSNSVVASYYQTRTVFCLDHPEFLIGRVINQNNSKFWVITPEGRKIEIKQPPLSKISVGQYLCLHGIMEKDHFNIKLINYCDSSHMEGYFASLDTAEI
jgi:hypothetical protein